MFQVKKIEKTLENGLNTIHSFIFMMKIISLVGGGLIKSKLFTTIYVKKRKFGLLVLTVKGFLGPMVKRKRT